MTATIAEERTGTTPAATAQTSRDPNQAAHIVRTPDDLIGRTTPQAYVLQARVEGTLIEALCGHVWIPSRDPRQLPICERCLAIYRYDPHGLGRDDKPED